MTLCDQIALAEERVMELTLCPPQHVEIIEVQELEQLVVRLLKSAQTPRQRRRVEGLHATIYPYRAA